jgi:hypothetical protein
MTEEQRGNLETEKPQSDSVGEIEQQVGRYALPVSGLLITGGAVLSLVMASRKVTTIALWSIPVVMYWAGLALAIKPLQEHKAKIQRTREEIVTKLEQFDPVAKSQVTKPLTEAELGQS